jgi:hypothetical protein
LKAWGYTVYEDGVGWDETMKDAILHDELPAFGSYDSVPIYQSDFSSDIDGWTKTESDGGAVSLSVSDNKLVCNVTNGGVGGLSVRVYSPAHEATKNGIFRTTLTVSGDYVFFGIMENDEFSWTNVYDLDGGGTYTRVYTYMMAWDTDLSNHLRFMLGGSTGTFNIESILIEELIPL